MGALLLTEHTTDTAAAEVDKSDTSLQLGAFCTVLFSNFLSLVQKNQLARDLQTLEINGILVAIGNAIGDFTSSSQN